MNLTAIRQAIAAQLTYGELTATPRIPASSELTCPHAFISDMTMRQVSMDEQVDIDVEVTVLVSLADADTGWNTVSELWDIDSGAGIVEAVTEDTTLAGTVSGLTLNGELRGLSTNYDVGGVVYLGFQMTFTVHV